MRGNVIGEVLGSAGCFGSNTRNLRTRDGRREVNDVFKAFEGD